MQSVMLANALFTFWTARTVNYATISKSLTIFWFSMPVDDEYKIKIQFEKNFKIDGIWSMFTPFNFFKYSTNMNYSCIINILTLFKTNLN